MKPLLSILLVMTLALPSGAYQILLDIDLDDNPTTINFSTTEETALVSLILAPDGDSEWIELLEFGLGGTCWMCWEWYTFMYGTHCDLYDMWEPNQWLDHPLFDTCEMGGATCIECCGNPGFHYIYMATAAGGGFELTEPIFLCEFNAWDIDHPVCEEPMPDLMGFACGGPCNVIYLSGSFTAVGEDDPMPLHWQDLKKLY